MARMLRPHAVLGAITFGVLLLVSIPPVVAQQSAAERANELLVRAIEKSEAVRDAADPGQRVKLLKEATDLIDEIRSEHASTDLAVKLATGQSIGNFDPAKLEQRYRDAVGRVCMEDPREACLEPLAGIARQLADKLDDQASELASAKQARDDSEARIAELKKKVSRLNAALEAAEAKVDAKDVRIANLSERLNEALANKVRELARYRSEFFGRLREVLGDNENIRVVGSRFVFQSEVLFDSGSAKLGPDGRQQIRQLADTLLGVIDEIPDNVDWILRVDGHTDDRPIQSGRFPSNWELSTARATEVVKFLIDQGVPPDRLAATGFGEYQPISERDDPEALRKNRRIEFVLAEKH